MATTTFYLVYSNDEGLEGSFLTEGDAHAYLRELREIGVRSWIVIKHINEDTQKGPREIPSSPDGAARALADSD